MIKTRITCSACHNSVTINGETKRTIGSPFTQCPWCHSMVLTNKAKEWNTMNKFQKFFWLINSTSGNFFLLLCGSIVISALIGRAFNLSEQLSIILMWVLTLAILGTSSTIIFMMKLNSDSVQLAIRKSNARLKDPAYRALLEKAGFKIYEIKETESTDDADGVSISKKDLEHVSTEWDYKNFMHRSAIEIIVERYLSSHDDCTAKDFVDLVNGVAGVVADMKKLSKMENIIAESDVTFGTKGKMKTIRIVWNNEYKHDKEIVAFYDSKQAFYFVISEDLYQMYMYDHVRGMDCLEKEFKEDGQYIIDHIEEICDYTIIADYPGFNAYYQNGLRNDIVQYLRESIK